MNIAVLMTSLAGERPSHQKGGIVIYRLMLVVVLAGVPAVSLAGMRVNLLPSSFCGPDCPVDTVGRATVELRGSTQAGARGLAGRLRIDGALRDGVPANVSGLTLILPLGDEPGFCTDYELRDQTITNGRLKVHFTAADLGSASLLSPGMVLPICGTVRVLPEGMQGYSPVLEAGFALDGGSTASRAGARFDLLPAPNCGDACSITKVGKSWIRFSAGGAAGDELVVDVHIRGVRERRAKVTKNAFISFGLRPPAGDCWYVGAADLAMRHGRFVGTLAQESLDTALSFAPGMPVILCSELWVTAHVESDAPLLVSGVRVGRDPDRGKK